MNRFFVNTYRLLLIFLLFQAKSVAAPQNPPTSLRPIHDTLITISNPQFEWSHSAHDVINSYKVQIAKDTNLPIYKAYSDSSFFPFHIGDTWYYNRGSSWVNTTKTIVDTMPLGKWKIRIYNYRNGTIDTSYEYWQYYDGKISLLNTDPWYINYLTQDSTWTWTNDISASSSKKWQISQDTIFGRVVDIQKYVYSYSGYGVGSIGTTLKTAKYLGLYHSTNFSSAWKTGSKTYSIDSLVGCRIGGVLQGNIPVQTLPATPFCDSPADKYKYSGLSLTLKWGYSDVNSVAYFKVQIAKDSGFTKIVIDTNVVPKSWQSLDISGLDTSTTYYWHVQGVNYLGAGEYCKSFSFTTADYPITIAPTRAVSTDTLLERPVVLRWSPPANTRVRYYEIWVGTLSGTKFNPLYQMAAADTFVVFDKAEKNKLYGWYVRAWNNGNVGPYSSVYSFKTVSNALLVTSIPAPAISSGTLLDYPPVIKWRAVADGSVQSYKLQIGTDYQNGALTGLYEATVADTTFAFLSAAENRTYYWHVCGANSDTVGPYSDVYSFKTTSLLQNAPTVHDVDVLIGGKDTTFKFSWAEINNADVAAYQFQIARDEGFTDIVYDNATLTETKVTLSKLEPNKTYYWHVRAVNTYHSSPYSTTTSFKYGEPRIYQFSLEQNYPNPFNPKTVITYSLPGDGFVSLKMYNAMGAEVRTLVSEYQTMNKYVIDVSLPDLPSGVYIYRLTQGGNIQTKKLMLLK